jgi:hypothetical protein
MITSLLKRDLTIPLIAEQHSAVLAIFTPEQTTPNP